MKVAIQLDRIHKLNLQKDSTIILAKEALLRGYEVFIYHVNELSLIRNKVLARAKKLMLQNNNLIILEYQTLELEKFDVVLVRNEPPFNMKYITATYILELLPNRIKLINHPKAIRNLPEKISPLHLVTNFAPETLITADKKMALSFLSEHKEVVTKPLYAFGGKDINKFLTNQQADFEKNFLHLTKKYRTPLVIQKFLPSISEGDKRVIIMFGKIVGVLNRMPPKGSITANLIAGGAAEKAELNKHESEVCNNLAELLFDNKIYFAGLDLIGGYITEINVTCPTGIYAINNLYDKKNNESLESLFWEMLCNHHQN